MGNCWSSPKQAESAAPPLVDPKPVPSAVKEPVVEIQKPARMTVKIYIVFYSTYGHIYKLAQQQKKGVDSVEGVEGILYQVPELLSEEVLTKMHAPPKPDVPILDVHDLPNADGFIFGFPTRYGTMAAQFKAFWDATGSLWQKGALVGKPATMFTSTASQGGGQETTILTSLPNLVHHGMVYVPPGYAFGAALYDLNAVRGGSGYGAGTFAGGDGSRQPSETELEFAEFQGAYFAKVAKKLAA
ncbi:LEDI-3 protein [Coccomyxa subellipsoidea C-169]|uniref:NAD(P)H dehydrogenase (quinone) n=1 Tax=Coccomyxa subellipsoidea (strain C-169) TaxID=574566 RepID=I0YMG3_COCSC|nr:LEDI-3 protein [Coccomyxa subellipsoidea C-169]EIE19582.1 LEDI-3 protein [Coccomyxa subellipsoidea C-169]|eukprot:XP_005644126.1 LEDI-3 protein [Coccomyxa subellipsoidea C-169]